MVDGGFPTTSKNLMPNVGSNLSRMKSAGDLANVQGKWGLAAWYPAARQQQAAKSTVKNSKRKGNKTAKKRSPHGETNGGGDIRRSKPSPEQIERMKVLFAEGK